MELAGNVRADHLAQLALVGRVNVFVARHNLKLVRCPELGHRLESALELACAATSEAPQKRKGARRTRLAFADNANAAQFGRVRQRSVNVFAPLRCHRQSLRSAARAARTSRRSMWIDALYFSISGSVRPSKRPPHSFFGCSGCFLSLIGSIELSNVRGRAKNAFVDTFTLFK